MFIRIKKRILASKESEKPDCSLRLVVVESYRNNGKPRQRIIGYLGSIRYTQLRDMSKKRKFIDAMKNRIERLNIDHLEITRLKLLLIHTIYHL